MPPTARDPVIAFGPTPEPDCNALISEPALARLQGLYNLIEEPATWGAFYELLAEAAEDVRNEAVRFFGLDLAAPFEEGWTEDDDPRNEDPHPPPHCRFGYFDSWMDEGDWSWPGFPTEFNNAGLPDDLVDALSDAGIEITDSGFSGADLERAKAIVERLGYACVDEDVGACYPQVG